MKVQVTKTWKRIVSMRMENGVLKVVANMFLSDKKLRRIIEENIDWINAHRQDEVPPQQANQSLPMPPTEPTPPQSYMQIRRDILDGRKTVLLGEVIEVAPSATSKSYLDGDTLYISEKNFANRELRLQSIRSYLKKTAQTYVAAEVASFGSNVSLCPTKIEFKDTDDFWVKCALASQRILCFDFRIVQLPEQLRQYVIAHAFAHFAHPLHDKAFWSLLSQAMPSYKDAAKELENFRLLRTV